MLQLVRSKTLHTLIQNARDFVVRSVDIEGVGFRDRLKDFPLIIMPSGIKDDDYHFTFIFNNNDKVPINIKKLLYSQYSPDRRQSTRELNNNAPDSVYE